MSLKTEAVGYIPELDGETLWLKSSQASLAGLGETELGLSWKCPLPSS